MEEQFASWGVDVGAMEHQFTSRRVDVEVSEHQFASKRVEVGVSEHQFASKRIDVECLRGNLPLRGETLLLRQGNCLFEHQIASLGTNFRVLGFPMTEREA